jgi:peptide deformylase
MKHLNKTKSILFLLLFTSLVYSQQYEKLTNQEKELILTDSTQMMRVTQTKFHNDSIILKSVSKPIDPKDKLTKILAKRMLKSVMDPNRRGVGIAAPQVGINRRMVLVQRFDKENKPFEVFINPEIIWRSDLWQKGPEGDLSFDERGMIMRHYSVQVQYYNLKGKKITEILEDFTAVIFQHERDHLDGILLVDRQKEQENLKFKPSTATANLFYIEP